MKQIIILLVVLNAALSWSFVRKEEGPVAVAFSHYYDSIYVGDTIIIPYRLQPLDKLQDTLEKYLRGRGENVQLLMFAQPTYMIDSLDLSVVPNVEILEFSGDVDVIENRKYAFMQLKNLKVIRCWGMLAQLENPPDVYTHGGNNEVRALFNRYCPDVRVRFPRREPPEIINAY